MLCCYKVSMKESAARFEINPDAAAKADKQLWNKHPESQSRKLSNSPEDANLSKEWMDFYIANGGEATEVGNSGIRLAPIHVSNDLVRRVDEKFWSLHPELN